MAGPSRPSSPDPGRLSLLLTIAVAFCHNGILASGRLSSPLVALDMGAGATMIGALAALFTVVPIVATVAYGRWVERAGTLLPTRIAGTILIAATLLVLVRLDLAVLAVAATLIGAGAVFSHVALTRAVAGVEDPMIRARNLSHMAAGYSLCQFVAPTLTGIAFDHWGARGAFGLLCLFGLVAMGIILSGRTMLSGRPATPPPPPEGKGMLGLLAVPGMSLWLFLYGSFASGLVFYALAAPLHGKEVGLSGSQIGALYGMMSLGSLSARLLAPRLARMLSAPALLAMALGMAALVCATIPLFSVWVVLAAVSYLLGCCLGLGQPITMTLIYGAAPPGRINESIGLSMAVTNLLQLITPLVLGVAAKLWGAGPMIWVFAGMLATSAALGILARPR